jgi:hypothetical protein
MKTIKNYPHYAVDLKGNVYSIARRVWNKKGYYEIKKRVRKLKPSIVGSGYLKVELVDKDGNKKSRLVHRIVAMTYFENPDNKPSVNHKDGNKFNNDVLNLEWVTHKENRQHALSTGLAKGMDGDNHPLKKLTSKDIITIIELILDGSDNETIGKRYGLHPNYISLIRHRRRWKTIFQRYFPNYKPVLSNKKPVIEEHTKSKIPIEKQVEIIKELKIMTNSELSKKYKIDASIFSRIRSKQTWKLAHKIYNINAQRLSKS